MVRNRVKQAARAARRDCQLWALSLAGVLGVATFGPQERACAQDAAVAPSAELRLGGGRALRASFAHDPDGVTLVVGTLRVALPLRAASAIEVEHVAAAKGRALAIVRVRDEGSGAVAAAIVARDRRGQPAVVFTGAVTPRGDAGERAWSVIEVRAAPGAADPQVVVSDRDERIALCGAGPIELATRSVDAAQAALVPLAAVLPVAAENANQLTASAQSPGAGDVPLLRALGSANVSSISNGQPQPAAGAELHASHVTSLSDGDLATHWRTGTSAAERFPIASFAVQAAGMPVRALSIVAKPQGLADAVGPKALWVVADQGPALHVVLDANAEVGQRQWVALPEGRAMRCLSVVLDNRAEAGDGAAGAALAEVAVYTDLDFGGGVARLVQELSAGGAPATRAAELLSRLDGATVTSALVAALPSLAPAARARAMRVLSAHVRQAEARAALQGALDDPDPRVAELALAGLVAGDETARAVVVARAGSGHASADAAVAALLALAPAAALSAGLTTLRADGSSERPALRDALREACERTPGQCVSAVRAWLDTQPSGNAQAAAALAVSRTSGVEGAAELAAELIRVHADDEAFELRWRLVQAVASATGDELEAWLVQLVTGDERWMLRAAALQALVQRKAAQRETAAQSALRDEYPRVRLVAVQALGETSAAREALVTHAHRDHWPMVRAAAYEALARHGGGQQGLSAALQVGVEDRSQAVRAAALRALTAARARDAWPVVEKVLRNDNEWAEVMNEAIQFARALCVQQAREPLVALLERAIKPGAVAFEADAGGPAFEALADLGGQSAADAQRIAGGQGSNAGLRALAKRVAARPAACAPSAPSPAPAPAAVQPGA